MLQQYVLLTYSFHPLAVLGCCVCRHTLSLTPTPAQAVVMFVSESGICRGPLAAAAFSRLLQHSPLRECLQVTFRVSDCE